jgi:glycosyltransferase involved in cell wall biosynthesis
VTQERPEARLAIVGPDNEGYGAKVRQWCWEQGIAEKVIFVDHLGLEEVKKAYVDCDVFVLPSYTENFGMTVVEAMACGRPVVISDQVNIWREVREKGAGLVVPLNVDKLSNALVEVIGDRICANEMGRNGRTLVQDRFTWDKVVDRLTRVYEAILTRKPLDFAIDRASDSKNQN